MEETLEKRVEDLTLIVNYLEEENDELRSDLDSVERNQLVWLIIIIIHVLNHIL